MIPKKHVKETEKAILITQNTIIITIKLNPI